MSTHSTPHYTHTPHIHTIHALCTTHTKHSHTHHTLTHTTYTTPHTQNGRSDMVPILALFTRLSNADSSVRRQPPHCTKRKMGPLCTGSEWKERNWWRSIELSDTQGNIFLSLSVHLQLSAAKVTSSGCAPSNRTAQNLKSPALRAG